jgi:hypothetical protein
MIFFSPLTRFQRRIDSDLHKFFSAVLIRAKCSLTGLWEGARRHLRRLQDGDKKCETGYDLFFASIASAAENFRSTCGSERRPPACSKQRWPGATPHVGQGTERNSFGFMSLIFIQIGCAYT